MESLIQAAERIGLPHDKAYEMVMQLMSGSIRYAHSSDKPWTGCGNGHFRGTGSCARCFANGNLAGLVEEAVTAAYKRAKELGG